MAQSVEQLICNLQVMGSSPFTSSRKKQKALTEISVRAFSYSAGLSPTSVAESRPARQTAAICTLDCNCKIWQIFGALPPGLVRRYRPGPAGSLRNLGVCRSRSSPVGFCIHLRMHDFHFLGRLAYELGRIRIHILPMGEG